MTVFVCESVLAFFIFLFSPMPNVMDMDNIKAFSEMQLRLLNESRDSTNSAGQSLPPDNMTVYLIGPELSEKLHENERCSEKMKSIGELRNTSMMRSMQDDIVNLLNVAKLCLRRTFIYIFSNVQCRDKFNSEEELMDWQRSVARFLILTETEVTFRWIGTTPDFRESGCSFHGLDALIDTRVVEDTFSLRSGVPITSLWELYAQKPSLYYMVVISSNLSMFLFIFGLVYMGKVIRRRSIVRHLSLMRVRSAAAAARHAAGQRLAALNDHFLANGDDKWELRAENVIIHRDELLGSGAFAIVYRGELALGIEGAIDAVNHRLAYFFSNIGAMERGKRTINVAVKTPRNAANERNRDEFWREVQLMKTIGFHPHILNLIGYMRFAFKLRKLSTTTMQSDKNIRNSIFNENEQILNGDSQKDSSMVAEILWEGYNNSANSAITEEEDAKMQIAKLTLDSSTDTASINLNGVSMEVIFNSIIEEDEELDDSKNDVNEASQNEANEHEECKSREVMDDTAQESFEDDFSSKKPSETTASLESNSGTNKFQEDETAEEKSNSEELRHVPPMKKAISETTELKRRRFRVRDTSNTVTWDGNFSTIFDYNSENAIGNKANSHSSIMSSFEKTRRSSELLMEARKLSGPMMGKFGLNEEENAYAPSPACVAPLLVLEYCEAGDLLHLLRSNQQSLLHAASKLKEQELSSNNINSAKHALNTVLCGEKINAEALPKIQLEIRHLFSFAWQISDAIMYLASKNFVHRDIAARNVLVTGEVVAKLSDFGLCRRNATGEDYRMEGNSKLPVKWMAIEALSAFKFDEKTDVWAFGVLLYEIFSAGKTPYADVKVEDMIVHLTEGNRLERPELCSDSIYELMCRCWETDPNQRPCFKEVRKKLGAELKWADDLYGYIDFYSAASTATMRAAGGTATNTGSCTAILNINSDNSCTDSKQSKNNN